MKIRVAKHTLNIENIKSFYIDFLGMAVLGSFQGHDGYDGIFIGLPDKDWHLEFTTSDHAPQRTTDEDNLLVFYTSSEDEYNLILDRADKLGIVEISARNPYWNKKGMTFEDPDGSRIVVVTPRTQNMIAKA